ncbi:MAG TPA: bifunctional phosphopantothenoylcysteine decarboxylase/phosphopantothenate--cysteine ligase CoaBC [Ignavibacteria bacterium]|nr:bifunctional phosphopantothenoylcysteine decarboxylase/phosphopantothenate--cysteine ligase CoaBC [Ignavibacteria bacterium]
MNNKKILIGISGGIAAYKICQLVRLFIKSGNEVRVMMTPSAAKLVSPLTLSVLSKNDVMINVFPDIKDYSKADVISRGTWHIEYGMWADVCVIAPATANTLAKINHGITDNFLLCAVMAARCDVVLSPTMDEDMFFNKSTQENISELRKKGYYIIEPVKGELASGLVGGGKMPEPEDIYDFTEYVLTKKDLKGKNILVTAGATRENIDPVRFISNYSTGKMGFELARACAYRGADVTLISANSNLKTPFGVKRIDVNSSDEMFEEVKQNSKKKNLIIMAAAVSDYKPRKAAAEKIKKESSKGALIPEFVKTVDILKYLGDNKKGYKLIGFALETQDAEKNALEKLRRKKADMIVMNNPKEEGAGFGTDTNAVTIYSAKGNMKVEKSSKFNVSNRIIDYFLSDK